MSRKAFKADLLFAQSHDYIGISSIGHGSEDGEIVFQSDSPQHGVVGFQLLATDVYGYPNENSFFVCTTTNDASRDFNAVAEEATKLALGLTIHETFRHVSRLIQLVSSNGGQSSTTAISATYINTSDVVDALDEDDHEQLSLPDEADNWTFEDSDEYWPDDQLEASNMKDELKMSPAAAAHLNEYITQDLRILKDAGYMFGVIKGMRANVSCHILSISIRVSDLLLSEEALQAWDLDVNHYLTLLLRFSTGYMTLDQVREGACVDLQRASDFRIGSYTSKGQYPYKPTLVEALAAFSKRPETPLEVDLEDSSDTTSHGFRQLFISVALNEFLNVQFIILLKIRCKYRYDWDTAVEWTHDQSLSANRTDPARVAAMHGNLPDHLAQYNLDKHVSIPLLAIQFARRYLVKCTDFCMVCHRLIEQEYDALKPYVCSRPLCLYQYMTLGFGPSFEHEILARPLVVDLLIGLCYHSAKHLRDRVLPTGMNLMVPIMRPKPNDLMSLTSFVVDEPTSIVDLPSFNTSTLTITLPNSACHLVISPGNWIMLEVATHLVSPTLPERLQTGYRLVHVRVKEYDHPFIYVEENCIMALPPHIAYSAETLTIPTYLSISQLALPGEGHDIKARLGLHDQNFDDLSGAERCQSIIILLDLVPNVQEMCQRLQVGVSLDLRTWTDRIPPAALNLLRWIIASNRSLIMQIDHGPGQKDDDICTSKLDQRVSGMEDWMQFRFAQGAPDKEQKFTKALCHSAQKPVPTLFAWHGSPLQNWHSIIREGLDYGIVSNGRAFGDGVYHSQDLDTSLGYSRSSDGAFSMWPLANLRLDRVVCMNEIINAPEKFLSCKPHFVVQQLEWIQCRYLFVKLLPDTKISTVRENARLSAGQGTPSHFDRSDIYDALRQDEVYFIKRGSKPVVLPRSAFRNQASKSPAGKAEQAGKRRKLSNGESSRLENADMLDPHDLEYLSSPRGIADNKENVKVALSDKLPGITNYLPKTDFVPGSLDQSELPMIRVPEHASPAATRALNRELKTILAVQAKGPLHELGWYIDANLVSNIYQWIVEFHSFDSTLPLAQDMKNARIASVVCEIRFPIDYPNSPPFVRVIRPRFLPFQQGGGGNITIGGAICMELLTNTGWSPANCIESVLLQVRLQIGAQERPARLESTRANWSALDDYGIGEAMEAYKRFCLAHGWVIPSGFDEYRIQ